MFTLHNILCEVGTRLLGAGDCVALDEAISVLDKTRREAIVGDKDVIGSLPSLLWSDSMNPSSLFIYSEGNNTKFVEGNRNVRVADLHVVGGCMFQTKRCSFPVSILYSDREGVLLIHACSVPFATIEAEFYDHAFEHEHPWIDAMLGEECREFKSWYKEAATGCRKAGLCLTPKYLLGKGSYTLMRQGVTAFVCLRAPENKAEYAVVKAALVSDLRVFHPGDRDLMESAKKKQHVILAFGGRTCAEIDVPRELISPNHNSADDFEIAERLLNVAILTWISSIVLCNAKDDAYDEQNQALSEFDTGIKVQPGHQRVFDDVAASEVAFVVSAKTKEVTALAALDDVGFTIPAVMKNTARSYTTKYICDVIDAPDVTEAVAKELFRQEDFTYVRDKCASICSSSTSINTAISCMGKYMSDRHAILVVSRDRDGRISNAKLVGKDVVIPDVSRDAMSRMVLYTWLRVVIIDQERVSVLLTRDPDSISKGEDFKTEQLEVHKPECFAPPVSIDVSSMQGKIEEMNNQMAALKKSNEDSLAVVKDFKRKLDYLVEKKADSIDEEQPPRGETSGAGSSNKASNVDMSVVESLQRSLNVFVRFDKRMRMG